MCLYIYIYIYIYMYIYAHTCTCIYICTTHTHTHIRVHICVYMCVYYIHTYMHSALAFFGLTLVLFCLSSLPPFSYLPCLLQTTRARAPILRIMGRKTTLSTVSWRTVQPPPPSYVVTATTLQTCIQRLVNRYGDIER